jgi:Ca2+-binding EF-hand superfamily protein
MKKALALAGLLCLTLGSLQLPAQAQDWFDTYDVNHDHQWNYIEFRDAHHSWARHHPVERVLNDVELRSQFDTWDPNHRGYVVREDVQSYHPW